ncbi:MAG: YdcF family protein [Chloroflexota bacterium]|nr:YdcF family protein [Chloroflexota bacterium]
MTNTSDTQPLPAILPNPAPRSQPLQHLDFTTTAVSPNRKQRTALKWVTSLVTACLVIMVAGVFGIITLVYVQARTDEARPVDAIVVMGAAQFNGRPSPVLQARLDQALALYNAGLAPRIVVTGGQQPGDAFTEAETGYRYLMEQGVPADAILMENEGRSTWESMQGLPAVLPPSESPEVLVVSDGFHLFRSELMLGELGYDAHSSAAPDSPIRPWSLTEFGYVVREVGGVIVVLPEMLW